VLPGLLALACAPVELAEAEVQWATRGRMPCGWAKGQRFAVMSFTVVRRS
jgi:hypothetical protein